MLEQLNSDLTEQNVDWGHLTDDQKDDFLAEWVLPGYEQGLGKAEFSWGLSAVQKIFPRLRIKTAWRVLDTWGLLVPVHQAPAAPPELLQAMVIMALLLNKPQLSLVMLFAYAGLVRIREALNLRVKDVILQSTSVTLCLSSTKTGIEQKVVLTNSTVVRYAAWFFTCFPPKAPEQWMFQISYSSALRWVRKLSELLGADRSCGAHV